MARKKLTVEFDGFDTLKKQLDELGGNATERAVEGALIASQEVVAEKTTAAMQNHRRTGDTEKAIIRDAKVMWSGDTASINVGFDIDNGGLPSIFLMYGTKLHGQPHVTPDKNLYNAIYGTATKNQIRAIQREVFEKVIERVMK